MITLTNCIICGASDFQTISKKGKHFTVENAIGCNICGMIALSPRMSDEELEKFYANNEFSEKFRGSAAPDAQIAASREERADKKMALIEPWLEYIPRGPVLEIGCSSGYLLNKLKQRDYHTYGIDPSDGFVAYARDSYGLNAVSGMYPDALPAEWGDKFSLIVALHVTEHTNNPRAFIESIKGHLADNGLFIVEVPDVNRAASIRPYLNADYFQKSHLWDFSLHTLKRLIESCGLEVYSANHYSTQAPDDKNVLIVAGKNVENLCSLPKEVLERPDYVKSSFSRIKRKFMIGAMIGRLRALIKWSA